MDFLNYIASFAGEGETTLIVKQKATKEQHKDGTTKHVWPAYLPEKWKDDGGAWYGNTGLFIVDRFKNGKPSASAAMVEYVGCMVLDDIGTKSKTPPLPPTWIMETSPGNFQWGYAFSEQPTKGDYSAAIIAIAAAGYTDPGAINPVRNFRLPGSVNLKPTAGRFVSRLVECHPDREYTLEDICAALGVTPAPADTAQHRPINIADGGTDDVFAWLSAEGLVIEGVNAAGWAGVVCPNAAEHSDGNAMGRYNPVNRAYCCLHAHCQEWNTERFLGWVEEEGGPARQGGLRSELLAMTMQRAYSRIKPGDIFSKETDAEAIIAEVEQRELARIKKNELHDFFAYVETDDAYFDLTFRRLKKRKTFDALYRHLDTRSNFGKSPRINAGIWFDENRFARGGKVLEGLTYAPGESVLVSENGLVYGNRWVDGRPTGKAGDITPWLELFERVVPDDTERKHMMDVMAFKVQHPSKKINHALLIIGAPGIGKDSIYAPFLYAVGGPAGRNTTVITEGAFASQFNGFVENEIITLNELRQPEGKDRRAMENRLKPIIAAPPERITVNRKNQQPYDVINRILVLAGSNYDVPISLPSDDRRWFVVKSRAVPMGDDAGRAFWAWLKSTGFDAVAAWLQARDVSAFNPGARPPMTEAKALMIEQGLSGAEAYLLEQISERRGDFASGAVAGPWHGIIDRLQGLAPTGVKLYPAALFHAFKEAGWIDAGRVCSREFSTKRHCFHAPDLAGVSASDLRRMVEVAPAKSPALVAVK